MLAASTALWVMGAGCIPGLPAAARAAGPLPGKQPLGPGSDLNLSPGDRCPVCGMRPDRYPDFACAIRVRDGRTFYFCSAGCMLKAWRRPDAFLSVPASERDLAVVREYFSGEAMDAGAVIWVGGSDVIGPMGPALVALADERHLAAFRRRHGAKHVFRLGDLNDALWRAITGR